MNTFAELSAESAESHLATIGAGEVFTDDRQECVIVPEEDTMLRDDDRRYYNYTVWAGGKIVYGPVTSQFDAAQWANDNHYRIVR